jgi:hypothetical protein
MIVGNFVRVLQSMLERERNGDNPWSRLARLVPSNSCESSSSTNSDSKVNVEVKGKLEAKTSTSVASSSSSRPYDWWQHNNEWDDGHLLWVIGEVDGRHKPKPQLSSVGISVSQSKQQPNNKTLEELEAALVEPPSLESCHPPSMPLVHIEPHPPPPSPSPSPSSLSSSSLLAANHRYISVIDLSVYSRNRCFRLWLSSKMGKNAWLTRADSCQYPLLPRQLTFNASLVSYVPDRPLRVLLCADLTDHHSSSRHHGISNGMVVTNNNNNNIINGASLSCPYPLLPSFITSVANEGGQQGYIRSWAYFNSLVASSSSTKSTSSNSKPDCLVFNIGGNRYCGRIQRTHKSNGIYLVANIRQGVWYQKVMNERRERGRRKDIGREHGCQCSCHYHCIDSTLFAFAFINSVTILIVKVIDHKNCPSHHQY